MKRTPQRIARLKLLRNALLGEMGLASGQV